MASEYQYSLLETARSIRLLSIKTTTPSNLDQGPINCIMRHFHLGEKPLYYALSYAWGSNETRSITLNNSNVLVRENLWNALAHIRVSWFHGWNSHDDKEPTAWIWIDALCIDQQNILERNHQVGFMGDIYFLAREVLVWLGCEKDFRIPLEGTRISSAVTKLAALPELSILDTGEMTFQGFDVTGWLSSGNIEMIDVLIGISDLFLDLPYWRRMWIVQEICLAFNVTIIFGRVKASWQSLHRFRLLVDSRQWRVFMSGISDFTWTNGKILECQAFSMDKHRFGGSSGRYSRDLAGLIESYQNSLCGVVHDKVYALLGLSKDCRDGQIVVDYSKSPFELYEEVISFYCARDHSHGKGGHNIIRYSQLLQRTLGRQVEIQEWAEVPIDSSECASPPSLLHVCGLVIGVVGRIGSCFSATEIFESVPKFIKDFDHSLMLPLRDMKKICPIAKHPSFALAGKLLFSGIYER
jgi:Heterokaryon incompatibility protein (HET)